MRSSSKRKVRAWGEVVRGGVVRGVVRDIVRGVVRGCSKRLYNLEAGGAHLALCEIKVSRDGDEGGVGPQLRVASAGVVPWGRSKVGLAQLVQR